MKMRRCLALLVLLASCATVGDGPPALCQEAVSELRACAEAFRQWQTQGTGDRPACAEEAEPAVTRVAEAAGQAYPDDPETRRELERIAKNLAMTGLFLQRDKTTEAQLLISRTEDRCAALP